MHALITDVHLRSAVAGLRGMGRAGVTTIAAGPRSAAAGLFSRYADGRVVVTAVEDSPTAFVLDLAAAAEQRGVAIVYPSQESTIDALLAVAALPRALRLPYPRPDAVHALRDKRALAGLAADSGLHAPATLVEAAAGELRHHLTAFPCVLKPAQPGGALPTARLVDSPDQLHALLSGLPTDEPLLVQERVHGSLTAVSMVIDPEGVVAARFQQRAHRTWPPAAGISSLAVSVAPDERLMSRVVELLKSAGFAGLAQLQFVESGRRRCLIDINPRFYGSLPLALACGVNLPAAWHRMVTGITQPEAASYRVGVTYRWLEADLMAATRGSPRILLRRSPRPRTGAVWALDDPLPGLVYAGRASAERIMRRLRPSDPRASSPQRSR